MIIMIYKWWFVEFVDFQSCKQYCLFGHLPKLQDSEREQRYQTIDKNCLLLLLFVAWKNRLFMIRCVWIRPHYNSRSKIQKFSKWKCYRWWSIRAPLILLHPNHPYSSNPIPPNLHLSLFTNRIIINSLEVKLY